MEADVIGTAMILYPYFQTYVRYSGHMDLSRPYADVLTGARGRVVAAIVQAGTGTTVRALATRAGTSPQGTLDVVTDLAESGIVDTNRVGRSVVVTLNHEHLAVPSLTDLVALRLRLVERLTAHLAAWPRILDAAWLFGSAARGDGGRDSDIDILLVASRPDDPRWDVQADEFRHLVERWTGNTAQLVEYDRESFSRLVDSDDPLIAALRADGIALTPNARRRLRRAS